MFHVRRWKPSEHSLTVQPFRFGWVNASYVVGLQIVTAQMKRALGVVTPWDTYKAMTDGPFLDEDGEADGEAK